MHGIKTYKILGMKFTKPTASANVVFFRLEGDESHRGMTIGMVVGETKE
jgi:hypothetical protein